MPEVYIYAHTLRGLTQVIRTVCSLREAGFSCAVREVAITGLTTVYRLTATPAPRPTRTVRGCAI